MKLNHKCPSCHILHEKECTPEPDQLCPDCENEKNYKECEWFELGSYRDTGESYTITTFEDYYSAVKIKIDLEIKHPEQIFFIDGWKDKDNPKPIWREKL